MTHLPQIILTCNYSPWSKYSGGGQKSTHQLANALSNLGLKVRVIYSKALFEKISPQDFRYKIHWALFWGVFPGISSPFRFLNGISYFFTVLKYSDKNTVIHSNGEEGCLLGLVPQKKQFIVTNRYPKFDEFLLGISWDKPWKWFQLFIKEPRFAAMYMGFLKSNLLTCTSEYSKKHLSKYWSIPEPKIKVIYNGIDPEYFSGGSRIPGKKGFLYFGRLTKSKAVTDVIKAFSLLPEMILKHAELDIVGSGPLKSELLLLTQQLGLRDKVNFLPWAKAGKLVELIETREICVLPSKEESFGNTMVECLAAGGYLISTREGSIPEVVGEYGVLLPSNNPEQLAKAMEKAFLQTRNPDDIERQKKYVIEKFSWEATAKQFLNCYGFAELQF